MSNSKEQESQNSDILAAQVVGLLTTPIKYISELITQAHVRGVLLQAGRTL